MVPITVSRGYFNDFVIDSKVKYRLDKYVNYSNLSKRNYCFATMVNKGIEPKTYFEASQHKLWVDAMNIKMDALYKNNTWELVDLPIGRKAIGSKRVSKIMHNISLFSEPKDNDPLLENVTDYQKLIGKLIYLTTTRPDITYTVSCLSLFMHSPLKSHLKTALKVI
ncbi:ribonuclease H-like domain-containing protein, partial [Tanacetum coccineum]